MSDRIKEIANQALDQAVPETYTTLNYDQLERLQRKFAELIIRECIAKIEEAAEYSPELYGVALDIQDHFGIDE